MRIHRNLAQACAAILQSVFAQQHVLDRELAAAFEANRKWGKRDRSFIAETCFEVVRWRRALALRIQSESVPALCAAQWRRMGFELPDWWDHDGTLLTDKEAYKATFNETPRAVRESIPDWLDNLGQSELGESWSLELTALNQRSRVYLRVNTLKTNIDEAIAWLAANNVLTEKVDQLPQTLLLAPGKTISKGLLKEGLVEIQDAGSQMIAPQLDPKAGEFIIDTCAGAGGKTLHLAALIQNQGRILATDVSKRKLQELERRAKRAEATCIETRLIDAEMVAQFEGQADKLLIDAPCSGLGTLKRQPDLKWRLSQEQLTEVQQTQAELLQSYTRMLKPGGRLVYATCSVLPSENQMQVAPLIQSGDYTLHAEQILSPAKFHFDGFYTAALIKRPQ